MPFAKQNLFHCIILYKKKLQEISFKSSNPAILQKKKFTSSPVRST